MDLPRDRLGLAPARHRVPRLGSKSYCVWTNVFLLAATSFALVAGCDGGHDTFEVTGVVQFRGIPVNYGVINFFPDDGGRALGGPLQSDGAYRFDLPEGEYDVIINAPAPLPADWKEGDPVPTGKPLVPPKYARASTSGLTATVSSRDEPIVIDFNLQ